MIGFKSACMVLLSVAITVASQNQINILKSGVENWNNWRKGNPSVTSPYLEGANLEGLNLCGANLRGADLSGVNLRGSILQGVDLRGANLWGADLREANLDSADIQGANLWGADLGESDLRGANLIGVDFRRVDLSSVKSFYKAQIDQDILSEISPVRLNLLTNG